MTPFARVGTPMPFERARLYESLSVPSIPKSVTANTFRCDIRSAVQKSKQRRGKRRSKQQLGSIVLSKSTSFLGYSMCTPTKAKKKKPQKLIPPTTEARPKLQRDLNKVVNFAGAPHMGAIDRNKPPNTHSQAYGFWKEQENIVLAGIMNARANKVIEHNKIEALAREQARKAVQLDANHAAIIERIRQRNLSRRSVKERMESEKKYKLEKLEKARKQRRLEKKRNRGKQNPHCRQTSPKPGPGPGDYDPIETYNFETGRPYTAGSKSKGILIPARFSFSKKERFGSDVYKENNTPGPGSYTLPHPSELNKVKHILPPPNIDPLTQDKTRFSGSIIQYLGPRNTGDEYKPSPKGWLYASFDHATGKNMPGPGKIIHDDAVRPGTCAGRISTAYPLSDFDIIVNRAKQIPGPLDYTINDDSIRRSPSFRISTAKPLGYLDIAEKLSRLVPGP